MAKMVAFFALMFVAGTTLSFLVEGQLAFVSTNLSPGLSSTATTISVTSTTGFPTLGSPNCLFIDNEIACYTGTTATSFTGVTRGQQGTEAQAHASGVRVFTEASGNLNQGVGYEIQELLGSFGGETGVLGKITGIASLPWNLAKTLYKMVTWNYAFLEGQAIYLKYFLLYPISLGLVFLLILEGVRAFGR